VTFAELIAAFALNFFFLFAGVFSLCFIFKENFQNWFLKKIRNHQSRNGFWGKPLKKSQLKLRRQINKGSLLAGAVLIALIFLPCGILMLVALIINVVTMLLQ
jgi:hypothetical protein